MKNKEIREILKQIENQFNCGIKGEYLFLKNPKSDRVNVTTPNFREIKLENLKINNIGLYFGTIEKDGFRLSIEGTELLDNPKKNVIVLNDEQFKEYMQGNNLEIKENPGYKVIKYKKRLIGTAKLSKNTLYNYISKPRRSKEK